MSEIPEPMEPDAFSQQLHDLVAKQMAAHQAQMRAKLDAESARFAEANRILTGALIAGMGGPMSTDPDDMELLRLINANADLKRAVWALVKGFTSPVPEGGKP